MEKIKETLRLKFKNKMKHREIAQILKISPSLVSVYSQAYLKSNISWDIVTTLSEDALRSRIFPPRVKKDASGAPLSGPSIDFKTIYEELKRKGVTLQLLWEEYIEQHSGKKCLSYSHFCRRYKHWLKKQSPVMRHIHRAGEKMLVDYSGKKMPIIIDDRTGEVRYAEIFVAVLGCSGYTYVEATWTQKLRDWIESHVNAFTFFGGVTTLIIADNLKSASSKACRYDPEVNKTFMEFSKYYGSAVLLTRPVKPRDKAKVESHILIVQRWILAALRNEKFYNLNHLNYRIKELLKIFNEKPFKKLEGTRRSWYLQYDKPHLKPLPEKRYEYVEYKKVKVNIDYHVEVEHHFYSVPYKYIGFYLMAHNNLKTIALYLQGERVAVHPYSTRKGGFTTLSSHMPRHHKIVREWSPERFLNWSRRIGPQTEALIMAIQARCQHPEQSFRPSLGILNLEKSYSASRLEVACGLALKENLPRHKTVANILKNGLDCGGNCAPENKFKTKSIQHENIRGAEYYQEKLNQDVHSHHEEIENDR